ncbi:MAG: CBS domain-containing protein [Bdellovibrionales bacterium]|nr:CBS domain-containing protein [Bdellovibrionales bacterium]
MKIQSIMTPCPYKITAGTSLADALALMDERDIRHLPVVSEDEVIGVLRKDQAQLAMLVCEMTKHCPTAEVVCEKEPFVVSVDADVAEVAHEMAGKKVDCALVTDSDDSFVGIFTTTDACRLIYLVLSESDSSAEG